jgi:hypothetical protein
VCPSEAEGLILGQILRTEKDRRQLTPAVFKIARVFLKLLGSAAIIRRFGEDAAAVQRVIYDFAHG